MGEKLKVHNEEFYHAMLLGFVVGVIMSCSVGMLWWMLNAPMITNPTKACWQTPKINGSK